MAHTGTAPDRFAAPAADGAQSYLDWGSGARDGAVDGRPVLVFSHGTGFNAQTSRLLLTPLVDAFRVVACDLRGHGASTLPADPAALRQWDTHSNDLIRLLEHLAGRGLRTPFLLVGHSLGASVSALAAAARPDLVAGLVLIEPVVMSYGYHWWLWVARRLNLRHRASPLAEMAERRRAVFPDRAAVLAGYRGRGAFATWPEAVLRDYIDGGVRSRPDGQVELACAPAWEAANFRAQPPHLWRRIARIRCPMTILRGTVGSTCPSPVAARLAHFQPGARMVMADGASHFLPMERPDLIRAEIRAITTRAFGSGGTMC